MKCSTDCEPSKTHFSFIALYHPLLMLYICYHIIPYFVNTIWTNIIVLENIIKTAYKFCVNLPLKVYSNCFRQYMLIRKLLETLLFFYPCESPQHKIHNYLRANFHTEFINHLPHSRLIHIRNIFSIFRMRYKNIVK